jgi:ribosomal protein S21
MNDKLILYRPYRSDRPNKKFYIINDEFKKIYFGDSKYQHYTQGHLEEKRKQSYIKRHKKKEDWYDPNTPAFWSRWFLWEYPTYDEALKNIKKYMDDIGWLNEYHQSYI